MLQRSPRALTAPARLLLSRNPRLRAGGIVSAIFHLLVILALLITLPSSRPPDEKEPDTSVEMIFDGRAKTTIKAPTPAPVPAPSKEITPPAPPVTEAPKPEPIEAPPPPPPPPPPPEPPRVSTPLPAPPSNLPPPEPSTKEAPIIPPPPAPPAPPREAPPQLVPPLPVPPPLVKPPPVKPSQTAQPNVTPNMAPNSSSTEATLLRLRQQLQQAQPPRARPNPRAGGMPDSGGNPASNDTDALSAAQRGEIGAHVRECWTKDAGALDLDKMSVVLNVVTDATGTARFASVADEDRGKLSDPIFQAFSERAVRALMDVRCATLPLPKQMLGRNNTLTFRFRP
jgi:neural Wiskott-Aldrich syndrome protein